MKVAKPPRHLHGTSQASPKGLSGKQSTEVENASHLHFGAGCRKRFAFTLQHPEDIYTVLRRPPPSGLTGKQSEARFPVI
ncbi:MAG: hypothetical protein ACU4F9_09930 [Arcticibacter sp.]